MCIPKRRNVLLLLLVLTSALASGCQSLQRWHYYDAPPVPLPPHVPRELSKVTLPEYIIEPPDILTINAINLVPKSPYKLRPFDTVNVTVHGLPEGEMIEGDVIIQPSGQIQLGYGYGGPKIAGLTRSEAEKAITANLLAEVRDPKVWVSLVQIATEQQISGEHLVAPDGRVNLGAYGRVSVVGMTIEQATEAIEQHLQSFLEQPKISVDVYGYNSKVYYVITQGAGLGDGVNIIPVRGNETVLDAIGQIQGLTPVSSNKMWIARPSLNGQCQVLPIDWEAITQRGNAQTNYQILPGDRVYVAEDKLIAADNLLAKIVAPIERLMGVTLLSTDTIQRLVFFEETATNRGGF